MALTLLALGACAARPHAELARDVEKPGWALYAVEYARSKDLPLERLVRGADPARKLDMSWYFYLAVGSGRIVMLDAGSDALARSGSQDAERWQIVRAVPVPTALDELGLSPASVDDVLLTHHHWDHSDGVLDLPRAVLHVHEAEWARLVTGKRAAAFRKLEAEGRLRTFSGASEPLPGIAARVLGGHTVAHTVYALRCRDGRRVVVGGDGAYTYENLERALPITVTDDARANVADMQALRREGTVLPGHDPELFRRFRRLAPGVAKICP
jgi:glyoxylase-like metal-dependent hydrolase (beta-lactamase superfamily II)